MLTTRGTDFDPDWLALQAAVPVSLRGVLAGLAIWQWLGLLAAIAVAYALGRFVTWVLIRSASRVTRRTKATWDDEALVALRPPSRLFLALLSFEALLPALALPIGAAYVVARCVGTILIVAVAWTAVRLVGVLSDYIELRAREAAGDSAASELQSRGLKTQVRVMERVVTVTIGIVAIALMLTQFEIVRNVGVSLLASAGLAGVVLGFAAQRTIGSLIAGIQLSVTQPVRIGDVVIIEKEWGTIEEITLTYVVVKVWDERRLIVPMTRFLDHPFENWTKTSAELHGTVMLYVDWALPVDELRTELDRILEKHELWDGRTKTVQVTQASERTLEVRVLLSAADAVKLWSLRADVREHLVAWLQAREKGRFLPRLRVATPD